MPPIRCWRWASSTTILKPSIGRTTSEESSITIAINLAEAEQDLSAVVLDRYRTHMQCLVHSAIALALTYQAQQQPAQALAVADMLPAFLYETGNTILLPTIHAFRADLALKQGRLAEASQWAAQDQPAALSLMPTFLRSISSGPGCCSP